MDIVIPYQHGNKPKDRFGLRYMLRSLEKHLKCDFDVHIYGDKKPEWIKDVRFIEVERHYPNYLLQLNSGIPSYENFIDVWNKLVKASDDSFLGDNILWTYDDVILLKDLTEDDLTVTVGYNKETEVSAKTRQKSKWGRTINSAVSLLLEKGYPVYNYETHLPRYFSRRRLRRVITLFPQVNRVPYAPSTVYYNVYFDKPDINLDKYNDIKAGFYGGYGDRVDSFDSASIELIEEAVNGKTWVNFNNEPLREKLSEYIEKLLPDKSRFEC